MHPNMLWHYLQGKATGPGFPVLVYLHGGAFEYGGASAYNGTSLARQGVLVVILNYRLGVFGKCNLCQYCLVTVLTKVLYMESSF